MMMLQSIQHNSARLWSSAGIIQARFVSIKTLPWCAPTGFPNQKQPSGNVNASLKEHTEETSAFTAPSAPAKPDNVDSQFPSSSHLVFEPIQRFGIVSAMSRNRVIGMGGKLPWDLPEDRKHFKNLTRNKILIVGRKTYNDTPDELNIRHARSCIVVSRTAPEDLGSDRVRVVRSFPEALHVAKELSLSASDDKTNEDAVDSLDCWVAGGEAIYNEALQHPSASELHLTLVDTTVDVVPGKDGKTPHVALFPVKYRWDRYFAEASRTLLEANIKEHKPACSYIIYRSKVRPVGNSCQIEGATCR